MWVVSPPELIREVLWNDDWRHDVWKSLNKAAFTNFWDCVVEMQLQQRGDWLVQLPHLWVRMCETLDESEEGYGDLLDHVILGTINSNAASALKRLLERPSRIVLQKAAEWKQRLEGAIEMSTHWPRARMRAFLSVLDRPDVVAVMEEFASSHPKTSPADADE